MIATDRNLVAHVYNPDNQTKAQLIDGFVVRLKQFKRIYKEISTDTMQHAEQHILLEGNRGMGKTTMLLRLAYQIENDNKLNSWLIPLVFNEEEYGISRLFKLWERVAILLADKSPEFQGLFEEMDEWYDRYNSTEAYEYDMFALLSKRLAEKEKKVILFIDNFGDIISKFKKQEVQRLREVLQTSNKIRIIGASSVVLEAHYDYRHPFYEFFKIVRLRGLNQKETDTLLLKLGEVYKQETIKSIVRNQKGRVETLRRLTGGVIRSIVLIFEIFVDKQDGSAFHDLEAILDKATPLYKHRMDDLPAQQQEIMQAIAMAWDAVNTKEIARITRIPSKTVSAQLRQLEKNELVHKILTSTKNHLYQIEERFFNIWYLMRHGRKGDKNRVLWLVRFLEEWCDKNELDERANAHISALKAGTYDVRGAYYMSEALAQVRHISWDMQDELLRETKNHLKKNKSEFAEYLSKADWDLWEEGIQLFESGKKEAAIQLIKKVKVNRNLALGNLYTEYLKDFEKAIIYYKKAIEKGNIDALNNLAVLYHNHLMDYNKAEYYYLKAIEKGNVNALTNIGNLYHYKINNFKKAEAFYLKAVDNEITEAFFEIAILYHLQFKNFKKAENYYLEAIEKGHVKSLNNLAVLYQDEFKDFEGAEFTFLRAVKSGDIMALNNLAVLYHTKIKDYRKAEQLYLRAIEKGNQQGLFNLAVLYQDEFKDFKKAEKYFLEAGNNGNIQAQVNLIVSYFWKEKSTKKALNYAERFLKEYDTLELREAMAELLIWDKKLQKAIETISNIWYQEAFIKSHENLLNDFLLALLANKYYIEAHNYFNSEKAKSLNLKDRLRPMYYATLYFLKDKYPDEYLRMGAELTETVEEIIQKVEALREEFKNLKYGIFPILAKN